MAKAEAFRTCPVRQSYGDGACYSRDFGLSIVAGPAAGQRRPLPVG